MQADPVEQAIPCASSTRDMPAMLPISNGHWETGDLLALTEQVERYRTPYGSTVKLVNRMTGEERHVARIEPLAGGEHV